MLTITPLAVQKCIGMMNDNTLGLRVKVEGGGCSGFQYNLSFDVYEEADMVFWVDEDFHLICDKRSFLYLSGSEIDYEDGLMGNGFRVGNPNANSTCGCGESFSV